VIPRLCHQVLLELAGAPVEASHGEVQLHVLRFGIDRQHGLMRQLIDRFHPIGFAHPV
jgi:hypothetical protein